MAEATGAAGDPALLDVEVQLAAASADAAVFDRVTSGIEQATSPPVYERNVRALGDFTDPALVGRALQFALTEPVHAEDVPDVISAALHNRAARPIAWSFVKSRWKDIVAKAGADEAVGAVLTAASGFCDPAMGGDVKTFLGTGLGGSRALAQTLERIQSCVDFSGAQRANLTRWLAAHQPAPGSPAGSRRPHGGRRTGIYGFLARLPGAGRRAPRPDTARLPTT